ncbi:iron-containing alcohol dehydrogenase [Pantoea sp. Bo_2]|uniref:iron-containing alcohol dehydrogenase n=1 Tax=unclassified Pantoea TaxID=2630326 RepID=UPI001232AD4F|nr:MULTISPECIES: iron-containing alcohol dehydrogenase [unclassified Pantoea]KAA5949240.1 iron-containing alcohol dehydrogenase [Pantoea sp. VH_3]KAA5954563.1 iron-containing alcohol dehydrogenase [Pantoea sp. VH_25]KAA5958733.1 iron-containing alcohol dehydrogenase [Pantoea sp. VH_24]KAA5961904.1 iron-containing alcohol dehydrogenase [Pantoea sp. VH_16]KAA5966352.1 iron-containing alcohol dehydrogenase [Pantoea sp. VH_18]
MNINSTVISGYQALNDMRYLLNGVTTAVVVTDRNIEAIPAVQALMGQLRDQIPRISVVNSVPPEPSQHDVAAIIASLSQRQADMVIGIGGGSVLDVAKLLSVLCIDGAPSLDALLAGEKPQRRTRSILIPTTAGTGSEATPNAILAIPEKETKVGIISPVMLPDVVALVPELTTSMPPHIASSTGIDALCHLIECFTANVANPVSDNYALIGMKKLFAHLETTLREPENLQARLEVLWASYYGGASIAHAGTHLVHAMSYPLGGKYHLPHGVANAILLAPCMRFVRPAAVSKFAQAYDLLPDADVRLSDEEKSHALVDYFTALVARLQLPASLEALGIGPDHLPYLVEAALDVQRLMKNVPMAVTADDVRAVYLTLFPSCQA